MGWARALKGHEVDAATLGFKSGDTLHSHFACRSVDTLLVIGSNGRVYNIAVASLPGGRGDGVPITSLIDLEPGSKAQHYFAGAADTTLLFANSGGFGLLARASDLFTRQRAGKSFLTLEDQEELLPPAPVAIAHAQVACLSASGRLLVYALSDLKLQPKGGRGLTLMDVDAKDPLLSVCSFGDVLRVLGAGRGGKPRDELVKGSALASHMGKRARKGAKVEAVLKPSRVLPG
jgi:topoisomerase-4 subunit A